MLSVFPVHTLDEISDLIASVSGCFLPLLQYSQKQKDADGMALGSAV